MFCPHMEVRRRLCGSLKLGADDLPQRGTEKGFQEEGHLGWVLKAEQEFAR